MLYKQPELPLHKPRQLLRPPYLLQLRLFPPPLHNVMGFQPLTGVVAQALAHVMLEEVIVTLTPIVLEILNVEVTIAEGITHQQEVVGQVPLIAVKVSNDQTFRYYICYFQPTLYEVFKHLLKLASTVVTTAPPPTGQCNGVPNTDWSCCTSSSPCAVGGGDCDFDSHCAGNLKCGTNNCLRDYSSSGSNWATSADCCEGIYLI